MEELRPLRHSYQESLPDYQAKKGEYDAQVQMIENTVTSVTDVIPNIFFLIRLSNHLFIIIKLVLIQLLS